MTPPGFKRWPLDERARAYVRGQLDVELTLCRSLVDVFNAAAGEFYTIAPETLPSDRLHEFTWGGLYEQDWSQAVRFPDGSVMVPKPSAYDIRAGAIRNVLGSSPHAFCVVDDFILSRPEWTCIAEPPEFCIGHELYRFITAGGDDVNLEAALRKGDEIWHGLAATFVPAEPITIADLTSPERLAACASVVREINVTAYDAEGFVAWARA